MRTLGGALALSGAAWLSPPLARAAANTRVADQPLPTGVPLNVKPVLVYHLDEPRERTSWRAYGGLRTRADVDQELERIRGELDKLRAKAEFPLEFQALGVIHSGAEAATAAAASADAFLVYGASGAQAWIETLAATKKPTLLFVRHKSGPVYLWYEIAHWRLLRKSGDTKDEPNLDFEDVVVDDYGDVLWRLRALYGLKNARGTTMLAIGGLAAYSLPGQERGPAHAKDLWGYQLKTITFDELKRRVDRTRGDAEAMRGIQRSADELLALPNLSLSTDRRFIVNSFLSLKVIREAMLEQQAANVGVGDCMGGLIPLLDTPPCLALSLLNDEGFTAFCHTDLTHTVPGVLLRWIANRPSFVCNSHFPHHGLLTLAHCSAPRKMNGRDFEPTTLLTHYESDYGAATKVHYPKGQLVTCIVPNLRCTKWFGFRARIVDSPAFDMCRSQMDLEIEGDWRSLVKEMEGFHTIVGYGDYLREIGYALQKVGAIEWKNYSGSAGSAAS